MIIKIIKIYNKSKFLWNEERVIKGCRKNWYWMVIFIVKWLNFKIKRYFFIKEIKCDLKILYLEEMLKYEGNGYFKIWKNWRSFLKFYKKFFKKMYLLMNLSVLRDKLK